MASTSAGTLLSRSHVSQVFASQKSPYGGSLSVGGGIGPIGGGGGGGGAVYASAPAAESSPPYALLAIGAVGLVLAAVVIKRKLAKKKGR